MVTTKLYDILEIPVTATQSEIKKSYHRLALKYHPDKREDGDDTRFKEIDSAYKVLSDETRRSHYDATGELNMNPQPFQFQNPFQFFQTHQSERTIHIQEPLLSFYNGKDFQYDFVRNIICRNCKGEGGIEFSSCSPCSGRGIVITQQQHGPMILQTQNICSNCKGKGKLVEKKCSECVGKGQLTIKDSIRCLLPRGAKENHTLLFSGKADEVHGTPQGNLKIIFSSLPDPIFTRDSINLQMNLNLDLTTALTGGEISFTHLSGEELSLNIPKGKVIRYGDTLTLSSKGMPLANNTEFGDLTIKFNIILPSDSWAEKVNKSTIEKIFGRVKAQHENENT